MDLYKEINKMLDKNGWTIYRFAKEINVNPQNLYAFMGKLKHPTRVNQSMLQCIIPFLFVSRWPDEPDATSTTPQNPDKPARRKRVAKVDPTPDA